MSRWDDAAVEVVLLEESWEDPRRRRQSALAGSVNQEPRLHWSGSQPHPSWSSDPKALSSHSKQGTYRPVASSPGVSQPDEAWSCLRVLPIGNSFSNKPPNLTTAPRSPRLPAPTPPQRYPRSLDRQLDSISPRRRISHSTTSSRRHHVQKQLRQRLGHILPTRANIPGRVCGRGSQAGFRRRWHREQDTCRPRSNQGSPP
jgi:hypothetical protein